MIASERLETRRLVAFSMGRRDEGVAPPCKDSPWLLIALEHRPAISGSKLRAISERRIAKNRRLETAVFLWDGTGIASAVAMQLKM